MNITRKEKITHQKKMTKGNNPSIALNVLYIKRNGYISHLHFKRQCKSWKKKMFVFKDSNGKGWPYPVVKKISELLRGRMSKHVGDFYWLNCLHSFTTENLNFIKEYVKIKIFCCCNTFWRH